MAFGKKTEKQDVLVEETETVVEHPRKAHVPTADEKHASVATEARAHLDGARAVLVTLGHFEFNQAVTAIDLALEWIAKADATDVP